MWTWRDGVILVGAYLPASLMGALVAQLLPKGMGGVAGRALVAQFVVYAISVLVIVAVLRLTIRGSVARALGWTARWRFVPLVLVGGPLLAVALGMTAAVLRAPALDTQVKDWLADPVSLPWVALFIAVLAPAVEELVFRGFFQPLAVASAGPWLGVVLVALGFALLHGPTYKWQWQYLLTMVLAGSAFGAVRHLTGSTVAAALLHASYNATMLYAYLR